MRVSPALLSMAVLVAMTGCARSIGQGVVAGVHDRQSDVRDIGQSFVTGAVGGLKDVQPQLDTALARLDRQLNHLVDRNLDAVSARLQHIEDSLGVFLRDDAKQSLHTILSDNLTLVRSDLRGSIRLWVTEAGASLESAVMPAVTRGVSRTVDSATFHLAQSLDTNGTLGRAVSALASKLVRESAAQVRHEADNSPTPTWVKIAGGLLAAFLLAVIGYVGLAFYRAFKHRDEALRAVALAIKTHDDSGELARAVQEKSQASGTEKWFNGWLKDQGLAVPTGTTPPTGAA